MIDWWHRLIVVGSTTSGKSELVNTLWSQLRCQRLLIDIKDEFALPDPAGEAELTPAYTVESIDWSAPLIHVVPRNWTPADFDALFEAANQRRHISIAVHEFGYVCDFKPGLVGRNVHTYISQGAAHGRGLMAATQRPVCFPVSGLTEAQHVVAIGPPPVKPDDTAALADGMRLGRHELAAELAELEASHGKYSFLWFDREHDGALTSWGPLPAEWRAQSIVRRRVEVGNTIERMPEEEAGA